MLQENNQISQHNYMVPLPFQTLPPRPLAPLLSISETQNYYAFTFFPTFYNPPPFLLSPPMPPQNQLAPIQSPPVRIKAETLNQSQPMERRENAFKNAGKKITVEDKIFCNCSKSGCLKEYCRCFRLGRVCGEECNCQECRNCDKELFAGRKRHKGKKSRCNCKKTMCSSKYCDCLAAGSKCGEDCNCLNCENQ